MQVTNYVLANHEEMEEWVCVYDEEKALRDLRDRTRFPTIREFMKTKIQAFDEGTLNITPGKNIYLTRAIFYKGIVLS